MVHCQRGDGDLLRNVLQVFTCDGHLLAEHDAIHPDPTWPACMVRDAIARGDFPVPDDGADHRKAA